MTLVFTDVRNSTQLWERMPISMRVAIRDHNLIMRRNLRFFNGYEVKTEGDAFMVSFKSVLDALRWCMTAQLQLLKADWPQEILDSHDGQEVKGPVSLNEDADNTLLYRGLSIRMGVHCGTPVSELDPITRRMDYFGPIVNKTARVCGAAEGGQILVSQDVEKMYRKLRMANVFKDSNGADAIAPKSSKRTASTSEKLIDLIQLDPIFIHVGEKKLKGFDNAEKLLSVLPKALVGRHKVSPPPLTAEGAPMLEPKLSLKSEEEHNSLKSQKKSSLSMLEVSDIMPLDASSSLMSKNAALKSKSLEEVVEEDGILPSDQKSLQLVKNDRSERIPKSHSRPSSIVEALSDVVTEALSEPSLYQLPVVIKSAESAEALSQLKTFEEELSMFKLLDRMQRTALYELSLAFAPNSGESSPLSMEIARLSSKLSHAHSRIADMVLAAPLEPSHAIAAMVNDDIDEENLRLFVIRLEWVASIWNIIFHADSMTLCGGDLRSVVEIRAKDFRNMMMLLLTLSMQAC